MIYKSLTSLLYSFNAWSSRSLALHQMILHLIFLQDSWKTECCLWCHLYFEFFMVLIWMFEHCRTGCLPPATHSPHWLNLIQWMLVSILLKNKQVVELSLLLLGWEHPFYLQMVSMLILVGSEQLLFYQLTNHLSLSHLSCLSR
jgi:hypothetical protein